MTPPVRNTPRFPHVLILSEGDFGKHLATELAQRVSATTIDITGETHPSLWPFADLAVLAGGRATLCPVLDATAFARAIPWFRVHTEFAEVRCGPVVIPGRTACHGCYERRRRQHDGGGHAVAGGAMPSGYARHDVGIALGFALQAIDEAFAGAGRLIGAQVRVFSQASGGLMCAPVVAVDRCTRCRGRFGPDEVGRQALWRQLQPAAVPTVSRGAP